MIERHASAHWAGSLKEGRGEFSVQSGLLNNLPYTFATRFESSPGTNPEELIAAAHSSCFSMALSAELGKAGITPESIDTQCTILLDAGTITHSKLKTTVKAGGADKASVEAAAAAAKAGCPISRLFKTEISIDLTVLV